MSADSTEKEVLVAKHGQTFMVPFVDGTVKLARKDHEVRTSDHPRRQPEHGERHRSVPH